MSINTNAMWKAVGIGVLLIALYAILRYALSTIAGVNTAQIAANPIMIPSWYVGLSLLLSCVGVVLYLIVGAFYGKFADQNGDPLDAGHYALGGGLAGGLVGLLSGIISAVMSIGQLPAIMAAMERAKGVSAGSMQAAVGVGIAIGVVFSLGIGGVLAGIGAALYAGLSRRNVPTRMMLPPAT